MVSLPSTMVPLGTPLPDDFRLPDPDGALHGPSDAPDAPGLLVAFLCNHCPYVRHIAPALGKLSRQWASQGLAIIGVNANDIESHPDDGPEPMKRFARENDWQFPYVLDETQEVAKKFRAACTPDFFLFDRDRRLVYRGQFDASRPSNAEPVTGRDLDAAVNAMLSGKPVPEDQVPSLGCNIKWKPGNEPDYFPA
jgi:thiol-disulfide isomerase/thioredoxin